MRTGARQPRTRKRPRTEIRSLWIVIFQARYRPSGCLSANQRAHAAEAARSERCLALLRLEARVGLVDDEDDALATHDLAVAVAGLQRLERATDLHGRTS